MTPHTLKLTQGAAIVLHSLLSAPASCKGVKHKFAAGALLAGPLDARPEMPPEGAKGWRSTHWSDLEITEAQREACKEAVLWAVENNAISPGAEFNSLMTQLGIAE